MKGTCDLSKNVATNEKYILRKMGLKFQSSKFNIYVKWDFMYIFKKSLNLSGVKKP